MMQDRVKLLVKDCVKVNNVFYCIAKQFNLIFSLDVNTGKVEILSIIPDNAYEGEEYCGCITFYDDELYIGSIMSNDIWIFNVEMKKWDKIERKEIPNKSTGSLLQAFVYNEHVYMIGGSYPAIIIIDPKTKQIEYIEKPFKDKNDNDITDAFFRAQHVLIDDTIYIPCCFNNTVLKMNLCTTEYEWIRVGESFNRYSGITFADGFFWLAPRHNSNVVRWDGRQNIYEFGLSERYDVSVYFGGCCRSGDEIYFWNIVNGETFSVDINEKTRKENKHKYVLIKEFDNLTVLQKMDGFFEIYVKDCLDISFDLNINFNVINKKYIDNDLSLKCKNKIYAEGDPFSLGAFLEMI